MTPVKKSSGKNEPVVVDVPRKPVAKIYFRYVGDGSAFAPSVGARDLTFEEFDGLTDVSKQTVQSCGLYQRTEIAE
jgi:hypothetical protein